jgi:hypothetical protein
VDRELRELIDDVNDKVEENLGGGGGGGKMPMPQAPAKKMQVAKKHQQP